MNEAFRSIPKVDAILNERALQELPYDGAIVKRLLRHWLERIGDMLARGNRLVGQVMYQMRPYRQVNLKYQNFCHCRY